MDSVLSIDTSCTDCGSCGSGSASVDADRAGRGRGRLAEHAEHVVPGRRLPPGRPRVQVDGRRGAADGVERRRVPARQHAHRLGHRVGEQEVEGRGAERGLVDALDLLQHERPDVGRRAVVDDDHGQPNVTCGRWMLAPNRCSAPDSAASTAHATARRKIRPTMTSTAVQRTQRGMMWNQRGAWVARAAAAGGLISTSVCWCPEARGGGARRRGRRQGARLARAGRRAAARSPAARWAGPWRQALTCACWLASSASGTRVTCAFCP